jgi:very-short-patch-repair endonuclease
VREITVEDSDLQVVNGITITTPVRTVFDCSRWLSLVEAVVVADALSHDGRFTADELAAYTRSHRGRRGVRQVDRVIDLMEPKSESPMETRVRLLLVLAGLPRPDTQVIIEDLAGDFVARADLGYTAQRLLIEYDGAWHWEQRQADDLRRDAMRALGWTVLVFGADTYYKTPELIVAKVRAELAKRAQPSSTLT